MKSVSWRQLFCAVLVLISLFFGTIVQIQAAPSSRNLQQTATVRETFDTPPTSWKVNRVTGGAGTITQSTSRVDAGTGAAELKTTTSGSQAFLAVTLAESASSHAWQERPGTYLWQRARVYI